MNPEQIKAIMDRDGYCTVKKVAEEAGVDGWEVAHVLGELLQRREVLFTTGMGMAGVVWHFAPPEKRNTWPKQVPGWNIVNQKRIAKKNEREAQELETLPEEPRPIKSREDVLREQGILPKKPEWVIEEEAYEREAREEWDLG